MQEGPSKKTKQKVRLLPSGSTAWGGYLVCSLRADLTLAFRCRAAAASPTSCLSAATCSPRPACKHRPRLHGSQFALGTYIMCLLTRRGDSHQRINVQPHQTCPELRRNIDTLASWLDTGLSATARLRIAPALPAAPVPLAGPLDRAALRHLCHLHSYALAKQWAPIFDQATCPFALQALVPWPPMCGQRSSYVMKRTPDGWIVHDSMSHIFLLASQSPCRSYFPRTVLWPALHLLVGC